jgi:exopolysaccharide biosynthesis polyprenyl glycosylphosphotransferase
VIRRFSLRYTLFVRLSDILIVVGALALSSLLRVNVGLGRSGADDAFATPPLLFAVVGIAWQVAFQLLGVYSPVYSAWFWREVQHIAVANVLACLLFFGALYIAYRDYSRLQSIYFIVLALFGVLAHRLTVRLFYKISGKQLARQRTVLIVGTDANARRIGETVIVYAWTGLRLLGYLKYHRDEPVAEGVAHRMLGTVEDLPAVVEDCQVQEVIFALKSPDGASLSRLIETLQYQVTNIRMAPDYSDLAYFHASVESFGGIPLIGLREAVFSPSQRWLKRLFDLGVSGLALLVGSPLCLIIAVAIRLDSPGPIIFRQERIGEHGRPFTMLKFRSMADGAEKMQDSGNVDHKRRGDTRITKVGRFLRRTSLDEFPQFVNIFRGDMSLVGPRPEVPWLVDRYEPWQRKRFEVPQGLTGWWQISGRADKPMYLHTEDDLFYIRNYSLWLDLQIIVRTILIVITGKGAF